ncbi:hypothetical protein RB195_013148 [Necator americanus]|uniref:Uncharacterized protein n=1 Tax=Necator americanus TaxID=51031 RepID=A0ABR1DU63_NECAM
MESLDCTERKLLRHLPGYFWPRVRHNEDLYAEIDVVYQRMTRGRYQHLAPPSKVATVNRLRFLGHILKGPADRLIQRVLGSLSGSSRKRPNGKKRKLWTELLKEDLRTLGVDRQFKRNLRFAGYGIAMDGLIRCQLSQKIEKVGQSYVQGHHTPVKMRVIVSGDGIIHHGIAD